MTAFCTSDSDCLSNQCCSLGLVCFRNTTDACSQFMRSITAGLKFVWDGMVAWGTAAGSTVANLFDSAVKGVHRYTDMALLSVPQTSVLFNYLCNCFHDAYNYKSGCI